MFEQAVEEYNRSTTDSMVEAAARTNVSEETTNAILNDTRGTLQRGAEELYDEIDHLTTDNPDAVSEQEMREIRGLKNINGTPLIKLRVAVRELKNYRGKLE